MKEPSIELIKALKALKDEIPADQFNNVLNGLGVDSNSFEDRIKGLEREYEFIGDLYICNVCKDIIPIDEEFTTNIGEKSCDAIITLKNDKKIMVEIKSTSKDEYSILAVILIVELSGQEKMVTNYILQLIYLIIGHYIQQTN